jgi:beta-mannosidase
MAISHLAGPPCLAQQTIDLQGRWQLNMAGKADTIPAIVPGTVHTDLLAAMRIADPFKATQETALAWIEAADWDYSKTFLVDAGSLKEQQVDLVFEGLDTYAEIVLNGKPLGRADNMHRSWRFPCKPLLKLGQNVLEVHFKSPQSQALAAYQASPYPLPSGNDAAAIKLSPYIRKAAYNFGWDFGPRLLTSGIWRPVYVQAWSGARIRAVHAVPLKLSAEEAAMRALLHLDVAEAGTYHLELQLDGQTIVSTRRALELGPNQVDLQFTIHAPRFWWPRGMGAPERYRFTVRVKRGRQILSTHTQSLGLRSIKLVMAPDSMGTSFYFSVNDFLPDKGGPLFIKGANYVPSDVFLPRGRAQRAHILQSAYDVHMNMLRVWGGGVYEDDAFYEWCDAHGMLVWQDLPFACMMYPLSGALLDNAKAELQDNVLRLQHHPSLALWCGNNEIDVAWHNWGWQQEGKFSSEFSTQLWQAYQDYFEGHVPQFLKMMDPDRAYIPTSPLSNWGKEENFRHKNMHYWGVWHGTDSLDGFSHYVPRFMSEYGFQSWPSPTTLQPYLAAQDWKFDSPAILSRQKSYKGNAPILKFLIPRYGKPRDFSAFCRLSQLLQRDAMVLAIEAQRMKSPFCMGTLYWQLNDCWPGPSWSTIDYAGEWKPAHYALKRLYDDVLVSASVAHDSLRVQIASEIPTQAAKLWIEVLGMDGALLGRYATSITLQRGSKDYLHISLSLIGPIADPRHSLIRVVVDVGDVPISGSLVYGALPQELGLSKPKLTYQLSGSQNEFLLNLSANTLAKDLEIRVTGSRARFSDNFFDLVPGNSRQIRIDLEEPLTTTQLKERLTFRDLTQVMGE